MAQFKKFGRKAIIACFALTFLFLLDSRAFADDPTVNVVFVTPFDPNPALTSSDTNAYVEARPTDPEVYTESGMAEDLIGEVDWSYTIFDALSNDVYSFPDGAVIFTTDPNNDGTFWGAAVSANFNLAGTWRVLAHADVYIGDLHSDFTFTGEGEDSASVDVRDIILLFSKTELRPGITTTDSRADTVTVIVERANTDGELTIDFFPIFSGGTPSEYATVVSCTSDYATVGGTTVTLGDSANYVPIYITGDGYFASSVEYNLALAGVRNDDDTLLGSIPMTVVVPDSIVIPGDCGTEMPIQGVNYAINASTSPCGADVTDTTKVGWITFYGQWLNVQVVDQFGAPLSDVYGGANVEEYIIVNSVAGWHSINSPLIPEGSTASPLPPGCYKDPVGPFQLNDTHAHDAPNVDTADGRDSAFWGNGGYTADLGPIPCTLANGSETVSVKVRIDGYWALNGGNNAIINRHDAWTTDITTGITTTIISYP